MTLTLQRHWCHWRVPSRPRSRRGLQDSQWPVSRPYQQGEQDHTLPNELKMRQTQICSFLSSCHNQGQNKFKTSEVICQRWALVKATSLKRPSQMYHWANSKLRKATVPANKALPPSDTETPSQSEIFSQSANIQNIQYNNRSCDTGTPSQREIFSETGTGSSSEEDASRRDTDDPEDPPTPTRSHSDQQESHSDVSSETPSQSEITQYTKNIVDSSNSYSTSTSSQSEIYSSNAEYEAGSESSSKETSRPSSSEAGSHQDRSLHLPHPRNDHCDKVIPWCSSRSEGPASKSSDQTPTTTTGPTGKSESTGKSTDQNINTRPSQKQCNVPSQKIKS